MTPHTEMVTLMFVDIVDYTSTTNKLSRKHFSQLHDVFDRLIDHTCTQFSGNIVKKLGDAFLITFKTSTEGVLCGMEMQRSFESYNERHNPPTPLNIRVALHAGEVIVRDNDVYGDAVNTASRIENITKAGDVVFSEAVYSAMNKTEIPSLHIGEKMMKGLETPLKLFKVKTKKDEFFLREQEKKEKMKRVKRVIKKIVMHIVLIIATGGLLYAAIKYLPQYLSSFY